MDVAYFLKNPEMHQFLKYLDDEQSKLWALMFMQDCYNVCNVSHYYDGVNEKLSNYNLSLRHFRSKHPWLNNNLQPSDRFNKISEDGTTIFYGIRTNPDNSEEKLAMVIHLEGEPKEINLLDWLQLNVEEWEIDLTTPDLPLIEDLKELNGFTISHIVRRHSQAVLCQGLLLKSL